MLCIVVSRLPALSQRLMLSDYQIGLDFASGVGLWNVGEMQSEAPLASHSASGDSYRTRITDQTTDTLCRIRRTYINPTPVGAGFHACPRHTIA